MSTALRSYWRGADLLTMRDEVAGVNRHYHFDHQGTTQALTDDTGAVTDRFSSDAWGVQIKRTGSSINRHWYIGRIGYYRHGPIDCDYDRSHWVRNELARWTSGATDPASERFTWFRQRPAHFLAVVRNFIVLKGQLRASRAGVVPSQYEAEPQTPVTLSNPERYVDGDSVYVYAMNRPSMAWGRFRLTEDEGRNHSSKVSADTGRTGGPTQGQQIGPPVLPLAPYALSPTSHNPYNCSRTAGGACDCYLPGKGCINGRFSAPTYGPQCYLSVRCRKSALAFPKACCFDLDVDLCCHWTTVYTQSCACVAEIWCFNPWPELQDRQEFDTCELTDARHNWSAKECQGRCPCTGKHLR